MTSDTIRARNRAAYEQAKQLYLAGTINAGTRDTFDELVKRCGTGTCTEVTTPKLAKKLKVVPRTIQIRMNRLKEVGLLRTEEAGNKVRKHIVAFDQGDRGNDLQVENDPDVLFELARQECAARHFDRAGQLALHAIMLQVGMQLDPSVVSAPEASSFVPDQGDPKIHKITNFGSPSLHIEGSISDLKEASTGQAAGDSVLAQPARFFSREELEPLTTASAQAMRDAGVQSEACIRRLAPRFSAEAITETAELLRSDPTTRDVGGLLVKALEQGVHRYRYRRRASSWSGKTQPARAAPPEYDESKYARAAEHLPMRCLKCLGPIDREWDGHCPYCEPEFFERAGGMP